MSRGATAAAATLASNHALSRSRKLKDRQMNMNHFGLCLGALLVFLTAGCQHAETASAGAATNPSLQQRFDRLDANRDGYITWQEASPSRAADFRKMDKSGDGRVVGSEYTGSLPFAQFDSNSDGAIAEAEFLATHRIMFLEFDSDQDARISLPEFGKAQRAAGK